VKLSSRQPEQEETELAETVIKAASDLYPSPFSLFPSVQSVWRSFWSTIVRNAGVVAVLVLVVTALGCSTKPKVSQLSGKVTFKGQPVPAGFISFAPDVANGNKGPITVLQIKDGVYDSSKQTPPGIPPGPYFLRISGFDGNKIPFFGQGKQIFNEWKDFEFTVPEGLSTKDFEVPPFLGDHVKIERTADT
jgi:hypothetical protein